MGLKMKDLIATVLVAAIAVPYVGYLVNGEFPFIKDPRGMSAVGLILGAAAYLVQRHGDKADAMSKTGIVLAVVSAAVGITTFVLAEAAVAEILLAVFMGSILVVWAVEVFEHLTARSGQHDKMTHA